MKKTKTTKLKVIEATDDFYMKHTFGKDFVHKGDLVYYKLKSKR